MRSQRRSDEDLAEEIARLGILTRGQLIERWGKAHSHPPPKGISHRLLELSAAYDLQAKAFGGLKPALRKSLTAALNPNPRPSKLRSKGASIEFGSQLIRVWNGRPHQVEVVSDGFIWKGEHFRSLTSIAYRITGARWSGPRFFGL